MRECWVLVIGLAMGCITWGRCVADVAPLRFPHELHTVRMMISSSDLKTMLNILAKVASGEMPSPDQQHAARMLHDNLRAQARLGRTV